MNKNSCTKAVPSAAMQLPASPLLPLLPLLAVLGAVTALGIGTSWAKHSLFPAVGAQGTTAVRVGLSALLLLLFWRPWRWRLNRAEMRAIAIYSASAPAICMPATPSRWDWPWPR